MWITAHNSIQGKSHKLSGTSCQDHTFSVMSRDHFIISLSDGAGSCKYSLLGAKKITTSICEYIIKHYDRLYAKSETGIKYELADFCYNEIVELSKIHANSTISDFSCTLSFVAVRTDNTFISGHIGDGVIGTFDGTNINVLFPPYNGKNPQETYFITSKNASSHFRVIKNSFIAPQSFTIISDGSAEVIYDHKNKSFLPLTLSILNYLSQSKSNNLDQEIEQILDKLKSYDLTSDDCSMAVMLHKSILTKW